MPAERFFDAYVPEVRTLCDQMYKQHNGGVSRRNAYHQAGIALIERLIPEFDKSTGDPALAEHDGLDDFLQSLTAECGDSAAAAAAFTMGLAGASTPYERLGNVPIPTVITTSAETPARTTSLGTSEQQQQPGEAQGSTCDSQAGEKKTEADSSCELCGYRPKGDPQWFKGSMAKHKKLQHSTEPPKIYKCPFPGCTSQYKNRPDNLRQHQMEKNHWVEGNEATPRRPSKRKKVEIEREE